VWGVGRVDGGGITVEGCADFGQEEDKVIGFGLVLWVLPVDVEAVEAEVFELLESEGV
jgi:hypothetical protein